MFRNTQVAALFNAIRNLIESMDSTGSSDLDHEGLTVVSSEAMLKVIREFGVLRDLSPQLVIGKHFHGDKTSVYPFLINAGQGFGEDEFHSFMLRFGNFDPESGETLDLLPWDETELPIISAPYVPRDENGDPLEDPDIPVWSATEAGKQETWKISQNLTDRWGSINWVNLQHKPLGALIGGQEQPKDLLTHLRAQMVDELTFIVRKDGKFGILFEQEFCCRESEPDDEADYQPRDQVESEVRKRTAPLVKAFPQVQFALADPGQMVCDRSGLWAFVEDGALTDEERKQLAEAIYAI